MFIDDHAAPGSAEVAQEPQIYEPKEGHKEVGTDPIPPFFPQHSAAREPAAPADLSYDDDEDMQEDEREEEEEAAAAPSEPTGAEAQGLQPSRGEDRVSSAAGRVLCMASSFFGLPS
jgi:hypothetical protein